MNSWIPEAVNFTQNEPKMADNNSTKRSKAFRRNEIECQNDCRQIHYGKSDAEEERKQS